MVSRKVIIAVDAKFFENIFEKERRHLQNKLGVTNLSQPNFTKMIKGFKMVRPKKNNSKIKITKRRKTNDFFKI